MFSKLICMCLLATCVKSAPSPNGAPPESQQPTVIPIVSQSEELEPNGTYKFSYETGNGIKREETSYDKVIPKTRSGNSNEGGESNSDESDEIHVQTGSYSYTAPDGTLISVRYIADENGFQPIGDHIPRVPSPTSDSSREKAGRALKSADSDSSGSAPAIVAKSVDSKSKPEANKQEQSSTPKSKKSALAQTAEASTSSTSKSSTELSSEANNVAKASLTDVPAGASTTESELSTTAGPEATTPQSSSSEAPDASTPSLDASSTTTEQSASETPSTAAPASTLASEESSSTKESVSTTDKVTSAAVV